MNMSAIAENSARALAALFAVAVAFGCAPEFLGR
jgi:hypothetical protein